MCFAPKIKAPKVDTSVRAVDPAPLTEEPKGILFGGDEDSSTSSEVSGRKDLKIKKETPEPEVKSTKPKGTKASIRRSALTK